MILKIVPFITHDFYIITWIWMTTIIIRHDIDTTVYFIITIFTGSDIVRLLNQSLENIIQTFFF